MTSHSEIAQSRSEAGFTLFEILIVLAVLALLTAMVAASGTSVSPAVHARSAAETISASLRQARSEAIMSNRSVAFSLNLANHGYQWTGSPPGVLPNDVRLSILTSEDQLASDIVGRIRFDPDGGSSGGRVTVEGGGRVYWVGVDWLSGRVSLEEKPR